MSKRCITARCIAAVSTHEAFGLRPFPYPYRAALAICSDIDETRTTEEFLEIQRFLNTKQRTSMGEGVGLEIGNSFYFFDDECHFSFFTGDKAAPGVIVELIRAGYVDVLHSYGDAVSSRDQIRRALDALQRADCKLDVWVNHYGSRSNLSRRYAYMLGDCQGDNPQSEVYHTDLTLDYGVRFAWIGATTRVIGQSPSPRTQGRNASLRMLSAASILDPEHPFSSSTSLAKEIRKSVLGKLGDERYVLHSSGQLMQTTQLRDGRKVHEFVRYCHHPVSVGDGATSRGLAYVISPRALDHLKATQGYMIVYTHLGKNKDCHPRGHPRPDRRRGDVIAEETRAALRNLEREYCEGNIYVTTTSKLLNYYLAHQHLDWSAQTDAENGHMRITIKRLYDPIFGESHPTIAQLQGLTFHVPDSSRASVFIADAIRGEMELKQVQRNPADETGQQTVTIPMTPLSFPL